MVGTEGALGEFERLRVKEGSAREQPAAEQRMWDILGGLTLCQALCLKSCLHSLIKSSSLLSFLRKS